eukprot:331193-Pelagomonas_calceolata.AAC.2
MQDVVQERMHRLILLAPFHRKARSKYINNLARALEHATSIYGIRDAVSSTKNKQGVTHFQQI